uniref:cytochrome c oxidase subunit III n=1 Tax=Eomenopon denticulatum TaxID=2965267 RepID=UPI0026E1F370|nr:cytochrome c oxidase subunit III [Eomenopon denticulatum]WIM51548.1 cytochrome c oxidase subunit 3 [Eomenopon denticulatum]
MLNHTFYPFHMVKSSPWPLYISSSIFFLMLSLLEMMINTAMTPTLFSLTYLLFSLYGWMKEMTNEGLLGGHHTHLVQKSLKLCMILFITSEVCFFISMFWSYFYFSVSPSYSIYSWPPTGISPISPMSIPLLGTLILISSGVTVTHSHFSLLNQNKKESINYLHLTSLMAMSFVILQTHEYKETSFSMSDSVYGSSFFLMTGFHGIHVAIGLIMLIVTSYRLASNHLSHNHHIGYECSIWYWHFVDVVWLFLYLSVYWWSIF